MQRARALLTALALVTAACAPGADLDDVRFEVRGLRLDSEEGEYGVTYRHRGTIIALGDSVAAKRPYLLLMRISRVSGGDPETAENFPTEAVWPVLDGVGDIAIYGGYRSKDDPAWPPEKLELSIVGAVPMTALPIVAVRTP